MKKLSLLISAFLFCFALNAQEESGGSSIADILNVETVNVNAAEGHEEALADYEKEYEEKVTRLDAELEDLNEAYKKEVSALIEDFTKVLSEGDETTAKNSKKSVVTQVRTMTMSLKQTKKNTVQGFNNDIVPMIRELPAVFRNMKTKEVKEKTEEYTKTFEQEYTANIAALEGFKKKEHLVIEPVSDTPSSTSDQ